MERGIRELNTIIFLALLTFPISLLPCLDLSIRPKGFVFIPMGSGNVSPDGNKRYSMGGGAEIGLELDLATVWPNPLGLGYVAGLETGMLINPLISDNPANVSFYSAGGELGLYFFPLSRLLFRVDGTAGVHVSAYKSERSKPGLFWRGGGEIGFRLTPGFTIAANGGWRQFTNGYNFAASGIKSTGLVNSGLYAGLTVQLSFQAGSASGSESLGVNFAQYEDVYPVFMQLYQNNPIGSVAIRNSGNAEIRNLRMSFRAEGYTASEFPCGQVSIIPRGRVAELPLYADFSPEILRFTDRGRILGELVIRYRFLGQEREAVRAVSVATHNRNMVTGEASAGGDAAALAAFISPTSPETLDFARFIAGLARVNRLTGHNQNMQYAIWLLEGLRASNIMLGETYASANEAQFPAETLAFRTGGSRDLALLFAAALEGVGISSAFISAGSGQFTVNGDQTGEDTGNEFLVAVNLGISQAAAETMFDGTERILVIDDEVWLPLSMNAFNDGFMAAWMQGAVILNQIFTMGREADFAIVEEAWASYPPAPLPELGSSVLRTDADAAINQVNRAMRSYITQEISPLIQRLQEDISHPQAEPGNAALYNRLAILQIRAGRTNEAKDNYEHAAAMGSLPAMTNRGNLALMEKDFDAAELWFGKTLEQDSGNRAAQRGMEKVRENR